MHFYKRSSLVSLHQNAFEINSISCSLKGRFARVEGKSVPNIMASGLMSISSLMAAIGSTSIRPNPEHKHLV